MTRHSLVLARFHEKGSAYLYQLGALECLVIVVLVLITRVLAFPPSRRGHHFVGSACWFMECRKHECRSNLNLL